MGAQGEGAGRTQQHPSQPLWERPWGWRRLPRDILEAPAAFWPSHPAIQGPSLMPKGRKGRPLCGGHGLAASTVVPLPRSSLE